MNKKIRIIFAIAVLLVSILAVLFFAKEFKDDLVWESTTDGDANPMQVLSMSEEEIEHYELSCLEKEYTSFLSQFFGYYIYEFKKKGTCYDYREEGSHEILIGYLSDPWRQVSQIGISEKESFGLTGSYRNLVQKSEMDAYTKESYVMNPQYDSSVGLFAGIITTKYEVVKIDKATDEILETTEEYVMTTHKLATYPIQISDMEHGYISYVYQGKWHNAYMIADGAQVAPKTSGDIVQATRY